MRTFVMGDIHGCYEGLKQCLARSGFNYDEDTLIQLGDIVDGWSDVHWCVEELSKIRNLILVKGNHDDWFHQFLKYGVHPNDWRDGGDGTLNSYLKLRGEDPAYYDTTTDRWMGKLVSEDIPTLHQNLFKSQHDYYKDEKKRLFIHGGFNRHYHLAEQPRHVFWWDRDLWRMALAYKEDVGLEDMPKPGPFTIKEDVSEVFLGHTATTYWSTDKPMCGQGRIWNLDTGAGWGGKLTIMDVDTKEFWQSDPAPQLYPDELGRRKRR